MLLFLAVILFLLLMIQVLLLSMVIIQAPNWLRDNLLKAQQDRYKKEDSDFEDQDKRLQQQQHQKHQHLQPPKGTSQC